MHKRERGGGYSVYFNKRCTFHLDEIKTNARVLYPGYELWVFDFLVGRSQQIRVNNTTSSVKVVGSPQGCVLSPLLFILYTNDYRSTRPNRYFGKFSDDTALLSLLSNDELGHGPVLNDYVAWCDSTFVCMNARKKTCAFILGNTLQSSLIPSSTITR